MNSEILCRLSYIICSIPKLPRTSNLLHLWNWGGIRCTAFILVLWNHELRNLVEKKNLRVWNQGFGIRSEMAEIHPFRFGPKRIWCLKIQIFLAIYPKTDRNWPKFTHFGREFFFQIESQNLIWNTMQMHTRGPFFNLICSCQQSNLSFSWNSWSYSWARQILHRRFLLHLILRCFGCHVLCLIYITSTISDVRISFSIR